jgi:hypothetical protein
MIDGIGLQVERFRSLGGVASVNTHRWIAVSTAARATRRACAGSAREDKTE